MVTERRSNARAIGHDAVDPLEQAQTIATLVGAGVKTVAEARAELGLGRGAGVVKFNPYHDERGQFTDAEGAVAPGADRGAQVADNGDRSTTMTDAGGGGSVEVAGPGFDPFIYRPPEVEPPKVESGPSAEPPKPNDPAPPDQNKSPSGSNPSPSDANSWARPETLARHFDDHGADFSARNASEYARMAHDFYLNSKSAGYLRKVDIDGTIRIYDPSTNTFGSYNPDGTTQTFYKPSSKTYWDRQPGN